MTTRCVVVSIFAHVNAVRLSDIPLTKFIFWYSVRRLANRHTSQRRSGSDEIAAVPNAARASPMHPSEGPGRGHLVGDEKAQMTSEEMS
jgi:hypothetical protein